MVSSVMQGIFGNAFLLYNGCAFILYRFLVGWFQSSQVQSISLCVNYIMCAAYTFCGVWCQETSLLVKWASKGKFRRRESFNCVNHKTVFKYLKGRSPRSCDSTSCMYPPSPSPPLFYSLLLYYELLIKLSREIFRA